MAVDQVGTKGQADRRCHQSWQITTRDCGMGKIGIAIKELQVIIERSAW